VYSKNKLALQTKKTHKDETFYNLRTDIIDVAHACRLDTLAGAIR
jgi:hypothetical protein